jgi:DNA mismatch repair protein MutS2
VSYAAVVTAPGETRELADASEKAVHDLEWSVLTEHLAGLCSSRAAERRMRALRPAESREEALARAELVRQALDADDHGEPVPVRALPDVSEVLPRIAKGAVASGEELRDLGLLLEAARELRGYASRQQGARPALGRALASDAALDELADELTSSIERDGTVSDTASAELRAARKDVAEVRRELGARLGQLMRRYAEVMRDQFWTEREGRFVLPVRADAHVKVDGIVLGSSASGGTLYVEPAMVTELGNRLKIAEARVEREVARVLAELSGKALRRSSEIEIALSAVLEADRLAALVRWAKDTRSLPIAVDESARARLFGMRHPLLLIQGVEVVPNDIVVEAGQALVISGPNAGGKTVALKCLGLAAWMVRAGVPLPVEDHSTMGWFEPVLTDVGDEQSLMRSLSTFSAHVQNLASILERASEHALVLLDEVAAGTDPEEGSALAVAVLEALTARRAAVAVTTHYERLKELGAADGPFLNASVGFDRAAMAPTFRLALGVPGASSALAVARRYGVPEAVVERARALLPERSLDREALVSRLEAERAALEKARREAEEEARRLRAAAAEADAERKRAREQERARLAEEARELLAAVRQARAELREARKKLAKPDLDREELRDIERRVSGAARHIAIGGALEAATRKTDGRGGREVPAAGEIVVGATVFLRKLGTSAVVLEPPVKGQVRVAAGPLKLMVAVSDVWLEPTRQRASKPATRPQPAKARSLEMQDGFVPVRTSSNTLDLRGRRVEEALDAVDAFVDRLLRSGEPVGYVLHGHGTGALKLAVRSHLSAARHVARARPAEPDDGGDAFTEFWLED